MRVLSRVILRCLVSFALLQFPSLSIATGAPQEADLKVAGTITDLSPASVTIQANNGTNLTLLSFEDFTTRVRVGTPVSASYSVTARGKVLQQLQYPPPVEASGVATAIQLTSLTLKTEEGKDLVFLTTQDFTGRLKIGSRLIVYYFQAMKGNFLASVREFGESTPRAQQESSPPTIGAPLNSAHESVGPSRQPPATQSSRVGSTQVSSAEYIIGSDDILAINVWNEPQISRVVPVRPDGRISLPLIDAVQASGLTPLKLQEVIAEKLKDYVANPEVTVIVQEVRSKKVNVLGQVQRPGTFPLTEPMRVLDAIAAAGGFLEFAKVTKVYILRTEPDGAQQRLPFNYKDVVRGRNLQQNVQLKPGDTIIVP